MGGPKNNDLELKEMLKLNDKYQVDRKNLSMTQRELLYEYMNKRGVKSRKI